MPTVLAAALVMYIGLELVIESLWQPTSVMAWNEWITVAGTALGCTILGFAHGIGIGLAVAVFLSFLRGAITSVLCNYGPL